MDNRTLNQQQNATFTSCTNSMDTVHAVMNAILLFFSFPATFVVIIKLLIRIYKAKRFSSAEIFLLHINLTNVSLFIFNLLLFLEFVQASIFSDILYFVFFSHTLTARNIFLLGICGIFYLAIVHPVTYLTVKTWRHWEWLVITVGWLYALAITVAIIVCEIDIFQLVYSLLFYNAILPSMFFNIATLRALLSSVPENGGQTLNPTKRKAFRITLGILVMLLLYYVPRMCFELYPYIAPSDGERFQCSEGSVLLFLPKFSEVAMPVIFLYSLCKLGV